MYPLCERTLRVRSNASVKPLCRYGGAFRTGDGHREIRDDGVGKKMSYPTYIICIPTYATHYYIVHVMYDIRIYIVIYCIGIYYNLYYTLQRYASHDDRRDSSHE
jgi:hypothetical protein